MIRNKESKTPERLFLGLALGLAASLCILEYGRPMLNQYAFHGQIDDGEDIFEEHVFITLPKPPEREVVIDRVNTKTTEIRIVDDHKYVEPVKAVPEFIIDYDEVVIGDSVEMPDIVIPPLPAFMVDELPSFDGYAEFLQRNLTFPSVMKEIGQEGDVWVEFAIDKKGKIDLSTIEVRKSEHVLFSKEVIRVLRKMPNWNPGKKQGKPVPVLMTIPVRFRLK